VSNNDRSGLERSPTNGSERDDFIRRFEQALTELPERQRQIFRLSAKEDLTYREIADRLGIGVSAVSRLLMKALRYLDGQMNP
tara:strand:+ start:259 stop:507 length:249 start_codon:yes stop_codon:yes gene_type:complete